jgi:hypothetical protein
MGSVDRSDRALAVAGGAAVLAASIAASVAQRTAPTANFISELGVPGWAVGATPAAPPWPRQVHAWW